MLVDNDKNIQNIINDNIDNILTGKMLYDEEIINHIKKKRGRKSNKELELLKKYDDFKKNNNIDNSIIKAPKKRGRKPKGGKLIKVVNNNKDNNEFINTNIILHLKCNSFDINENNIFLTNMTYNPNIENIKPFNEIDNDTFNTQYFIQVDKDKPNENVITNNFSNDDDKNNNNNTDISLKLIWMKLKELQNNFSNKSICDKKSHCFWCTCDFDWPTTHIPKSIINGKVEVYGCFCMPECATAYLFNEDIDNSTKWERYALLNNIYHSIYEYTNNIKPAPNPRYLLDKYFGNLSIDEFRTLIRRGKQMLIIDKPLTHVLPELIEDNIDGSSINGDKQYKLYRNKPSYNKLKTNNKSWAF
jgi:hypothetical protein